MNLTKVDLKDTHQFSSLLLDYINDEGQLKDFYGQRPEVSGFEHQIASRNFPSENRRILCQVLSRQYKDLEVSDVVRQNLQLLADENTFTITTGHQLNIFTGPLYFIYKIVTVINACKRLKAAYPDKNFIPVYWMASEDHDFDEISYFRLNGKKHQWSTTQKGAVGHFDPGELKELIDDIAGVPDIFKTAYLERDNLADAARYYVNELFGKYGLVTINADDHELKSLFTAVIEDDIFNNTPQQLVEKHSASLDALGYKTQVHAREINFFYISEGLRSRIVHEGDQFKVLDTELSFDSDELKALIHQHPEHFSPNVILRPVYEEVVLPNLAYIGGPAEVTYWLQLKPVFDHYQIAFPILMPRNFAMVIPRHVRDKWIRTGLSINDLFLDKHVVANKAVKQQALHDIHLNGQKEEIMTLFEQIKMQAASIDPTLTAHVEAQQTMTQKKLEAIERKFIKAEKRHQADRLRQIESVLDYLFPNGNPQERTDNFLNFYQVNTDFIDQLIMHFDAFDYRYNVLINDS